MNANDDVIARARELMSIYTDDEILAELSHWSNVDRVHYAVRQKLLQEFHCSTAVTTTAIVKVLRERRAARKDKEL